VITAEKTDMYVKYLLANVQTYHLLQFLHPSNQFNLKPFLRDSLLSGLAFFPFIFATYFGKYVANGSWLMFKEKVSFNQNFGKRPNWGRCYDFKNISAKKWRKWRK
jgi:hypothetical protein